MELGDVIIKDEIRDEDSEYNMDNLLHGLNISGDTDEKKTKIMNATEKMPKLYEEIIIKRYLEGKDTKIMAKEMRMLGYNTKNIHKNRMGAFSMIRIILDREMQKKTDTGFVSYLIENTNLSHNDISYLIDLYNTEHIHLTDFVKENGYRHSTILNLLKGDKEIVLLESRPRDYIAIASEEYLLKKIKEDDRDLNDFLTSLPDEPGENPIEKKVRIKELIGKLPFPYNKVGEMYFFENRNFNFIATQIEKCQTEVKLRFKKLKSMIEVLTDPKIKEKPFLDSLNEKTKTAHKGKLIFQIADVLGRNLVPLYRITKKDKRTKEKKYTPQVVEYLVGKGIISVEYFRGVRFVENEDALKKLREFYKNNWKVSTLAKNFGITYGSVKNNIVYGDIDAIKIGGRNFINIDKLIETNYFHKNKEKFVPNIIANYRSSKKEYLEECITKIFSKKINDAISTLPELRGEDKKALSNFGKEALFKLIKKIDCSKNLYGNLSDRLYNTMINAWMMDYGTTIKRDYSK